ncbi:MAG: SRPBCC family protein, partial [Phycisphaeraceae bacterium]|nr:SRPBCC family protein [Phycisphaeraceae bacterium]
LILHGAWRHHEAALSEGPVSIARTADGWRLETTQVFHAPLEKVFDFFADAGNLQAITPDHLRFEILTPLPIDMHDGTRIDYRIRLLGVPMKWKTVIPTWEPPHRFVDQQISGPYHRWIHEHRFETEGDRVIMHDRVDYRPRGGPLIHRLFVADQLKSIFNFRRRVLAERFATSTDQPSDAVPAQPTAVLSPA